MLNKMLLVLWGESFRSGAQMTRTRGTGDYSKRQKLATTSHLNLIKKIKSKYSLDCDIMVNSYTLNNHDDKKLLSWYEDHAANHNTKFVYELHDKMFKTESDIMSYTYDKFIPSINDYDYVLVLRIDFYLKKYFIENFFLDSEKIIFGHIDITGNDVNSSKFDVSNGLVSLPKKLFYIIEDKIIHKSNHNSRNRLIEYDNNLIDNIDYYVKTPHICSTDLGWNPIYFQVGRFGSRRYDHKLYTSYKSNIELYYDVEEKKFKKDINQTVKFWNPYINEEILEENLKLISDD
jgi:hypothetical protein